MKHLAIVLLLALSCVPILKQTNAAPKSRDSFIVGVAPKARLQLTTTVVKERACFPGHLSLQLRFTFRNVGEEPLIVDKRSFITRSLVSRSFKAGIGKKYEQEIRADLFADSFPVNPSDMSDFVVIRPGEIYDLQSHQTRVSLYVNEGKQQSDDNLRPGGYFLQVEVATWTYLGDAVQFREKWKANGLLWSEGLTSQPMPFTIEQNRPIEKCT